MNLRTELNSFQIEVEIFKDSEKKETLIIRLGDKEVFFDGKNLYHSDSVKAIVLET